MFKAVAILHSHMQEQIIPETPLLDWISNFVGQASVKPTMLACEKCSRIGMQVCSMAGAACQDSSASRIPTCPLERLLSQFPVHLDSAWVDVCVVREAGRQRNFALKLLLVAEGLSMRPSLSETMRNSCLLHFGSV